MFLGRRGCDCTKPRLGQKCRAEHLQRGARLSVRKGSQAVAAASWEPFHLLPLAWGPEKMLCRVAAAQEGKGPLWDVLRSGGAGQVLHGTSCVSAGSWELHFWEPPLSSASPVALVFCLCFCCTQALLKQCPGKEGSCGICVLWH